MKSQTLILLIVAAGCGLVAMLGVQQVLNKEGEDETEKVQVLQASADIDIGVPLSEANCHFVMVDVTMIPEGAIMKMEQTKERTLLIPVNSGDWITDKKLGEPGLIGTAVSIPQGMHVSTISVDATTTHSGMLQPGHRVDVMLNYETKDEKTRERLQKVRRILQYVEVFAVDDKVYGRDREGEAVKAKNISLLVTPNQALYLELAKTQGRMSTVLRRTNDSTELTSNELSKTDLDAGDPEVNRRTALDANELPDFGAEEESEEGMFELLAETFAGAMTGPLSDSADPATWNVVIWEGTNARVETVYLDSDLPIQHREDDSGLLKGSGVSVPGEAPNGEGRLKQLEGITESTPDLWESLGD